MLAGLPGAARAGLHRDPRGRLHPAGRLRAGRRPRAARVAARGRRRRWSAGRPRSTQSVLERIGQAHARPPEGFTVHPKLAQLLEKRAADVQRGRHRLGLRRAPRLRLAAHGGHAGAPRRAGLAPRHVRAAARRDARPRDRRRVDPAAVPVGATRRSSGSTTPRCQRVRGARLRVRLLGRAPGRARAVGGAVRRLRQRRPDDHRRVHLLRRAEVGPALLGRAAAAARLRGPGAGPLLRPHRAVPAAVRRGQHDGRAAVARRRRTSTCCAARPTPARAVRSWCSRPKSMLRLKAAASPVEDFTERHLPRGHRRRPRRGQRRRRSTACCCARARSTTTCSPQRAKSGRHADGDRPPRAALPARGRDAPRGRSRRSATPSSCGCRTSRENQGAWPFIALNARAECVGRQLRVVSRPASASPAAGSAKKHQAEQTDLVERAFAR